MLEPILPAKIIAIMAGPSSRIIETATTAGNIETAPNCSKVGRDCMVITIPRIKAVSATSGNDLYPIKIRLPYYLTKFIRRLNSFFEKAKKKTWLVR